MSSKTLGVVRQQLHDEIKPRVPTRWRIVPNLSEALKLTGTAVYFEFTSITREAGGNLLPPGQVFCDFDLVVVTPETATVKAEDAVDAAVVDLLLALAYDTQTHWDTAKKERLSGGQLAWRVSLTVIANTTTN